MAQMVFAAGKNREDFCGLDCLFEFTNHDGKLQRTNCGQAAAATMLTHHGILQHAAEKAGEVMAVLEKHFPPDQFFGVFGTGKKQVKRICQSHQLPVTEIKGEESLRKYLRYKNPVIVMLGVSGGRLFNRIDLPGGHWMVAYGYDEEHVYLTNWGCMSWQEFRIGWRSMVPRLISMNERGLTPAGWTAKDHAKETDGK